MIFEDGTEAAAAAAHTLKVNRRRTEWPGFELMSVSEFVAAAEGHKLTEKEKRVIVDQAILLIEQFHAHLPFKRARFAADPVQALRLVYASVGEIGELEFHALIVRAMTSLRDAHTFYGLPRPFRDSCAFLPLTIKPYFDQEGRRRFIVTELMDGFSHPHFGVNAEVTSWNGVPIGRAVERQGESEAGANAAARFARGLLRMTYRSLTFTTPPEHHRVTIEYIPEGGSHAHPHLILIPWTVGVNCALGGRIWGTRRSTCEPVAHLIDGHKCLFPHGGHGAGQTWKKNGNSGQPKRREPSATESSLPDLIRFQHSSGRPHKGTIDPATLRDPKHPDRKFGYIRIDSFDTSDADAFVAEFGRIVESMQSEAPDGLIVDVRSNPGGEITAAERILQFFTSSQVQPAGFQFINSLGTRMAASRAQELIDSGEASRSEDELQPWIDDLVNAVAAGELSSWARPLTDTDLANDTGQLYQGPVALLIDALSYSATDIFAGGFADNRAGMIVGVDPNTGGGGANRWLHEDMRKKLPVADGLFQPLPRGAQMGVAIRRSVRVGKNDGSPLEDLGASCDIGYKTTLTDLRNDEKDLFRFLCETLGKQRTVRLRILDAVRGPDSVAVTVDALNLDRVECLVNGLTQCSFSATSPQPFHVTTAGVNGKAALLQVNGYALFSDPITGGDELRLVATASRPIHSQAQTKRKARGEAHKPRKTEPRWKSRAAAG